MGVASRRGINMSEGTAILVFRTYISIRIDIHIDFRIFLRAAPRRAFSFVHIKIFMYVHTCMRRPGCFPLENEALGHFASRLLVPYYFRIVY